MKLHNLLTLTEQKLAMPKIGAYFRYRKSGSSFTDSSVVDDIIQDNGSYIVVTAKGEHVAPRQITGWKNPDDNDYAWRKIDGSVTHHVPSAD